jgi:hypothetical protein
LKAINPKNAPSKVVESVMICLAASSSVFSEPVSISSNSLSSRSSSGESGADSTKISFSLLVRFAIISAFHNKLELPATVLAGYFKLFIVLFLPTKDNSFNQRAIFLAQLGKVKAVGL